jgi:hypothetical protein
MYWVFSFSRFREDCRALSPTISVDREVALQVPPQTKGEFFFEGQKENLRCACKGIIKDLEGKKMASFQVTKPYLPCRHPSCRVTNDFGRVCVCVCVCGGVGNQWP